MDKIFKHLVTALSALLAACTALLTVCIPGGLDFSVKLDFFSASQIAENIENIELNMTTVIYVKNGKGKWTEAQHLHGSENRIWVNLEDIPQRLIDAFVAIEDERYFEHPGVDWKRTVAAVLNQFLHFNARDFGGSSITQQLIKNITGDNEHDAARKFREIVRACLIERKLSKQQIIEAYLNTVSLGNGICGVQVAANYYFNKDVAELSVTQCAALAAITQNPSRYNPVSGAEENRTRRRVVLDKMLELGKITYEEYDTAYNEDLVLDNSQKKTYEAEINSYFVDALIDQVIKDLKNKYQLSSDVASNMFYNGGLQIYATMDPDIQSEMEKVYGDVRGYFNQTATNSKGEKVHAQSAMTVMDYEGHIVGMVGGAGEKTTNRGLNRATDYPRQPGSTMKPLGVYALAIDRDVVDYTSPVLDQPIRHYYQDGKSGPKEWYGYYKGMVTLNFAIRKSCNTIPVRLLQDQIGIEDSYEFLTKKLHLSHLVEQDKNLSSLALGGCTYGVTTTESAAAYAIFGNLGVYHA
ncbi:MAG: penicillin-binding protein, partial [Clostridia bacterium]|nr:penicillin-binding protein [Clostridia bacterium]